MRQHRRGRCGLLICAWLFAWVCAGAQAWAAEAALPRMHIVPGLEEPLVATELATQDNEEAALTSAIEAFQSRAREDDFGALTAFLQQFPKSRWAVALHTNLGYLNYHYGYFSRSIASWDQAWHLGRSSDDLSVKALSDRAVGELARMHARLGHADVLQALLSEIGERPISGSATEAVTGAREGLWVMRNEPGIAYLCGPMALKNVLVFEKYDPKAFAFLDKVRSGPNGVTLAQVSRYATKAGMRHRIVRRDAGEDVPVPSIIHWKVSHFAAIVGTNGDRYHVIDPTFGKDLWITRSAIDGESDGYFLVPERVRGTSWRTASLTERSRVRGMGFPATSEAEDTPPKACPAQPTDPNAPPTTDGTQPMASYCFGEMLVNLQIKDHPVGYIPPVGPSARIGLYYNQREAFQPATFSYFNVGQKWTLDVLSYITDDPRSAGSSVSRYGRGGGTVNYESYNGTTGAFTPETRDASVLSRTTTGAIVYTRSMADGSTETYAASDGATTYPRRIFLTRVTDPAGNALTFAYDSQRRLTGITDATGRVTTLSYGLPGSPLVVTQITDPFGRKAQLAYDATGRLSSITDILGLTSQFTYDASSLINAMTTLYGKTSFTYGQNGTYRFLTATDPLGYTERLEWYQPAPSNVPYSEPASTIPAGLASPFNAYINGRDTFYWDKHAYAVGAGDYTKARIRHWMHLSSNSNVMYHALESYKYPLENRVWMSYPNQSSTGFSGSLDSPTQIGRVLDDGTTQMQTLSYNSRGRVSSTADPIGRKTVYNYAVNGVDLLAIQQRTSNAGALSTLASFTYDDKHRRLTSTDAAGKTTRLAYNAAGQLISSTDPLNQTNRYEYDSFGRMVSAYDALGAVHKRLSYDAFDRVASTTDSEGYTVSYTYDDFDRPTRITYPDGSTSEFTYDRLDLVRRKDRLNQVTRYTYDANRRLTGISDPLSNTIRLSYFENGVLSSVSDPLGNRTSWGVDVQSRAVTKTYADGRTQTLAYEGTTSRLKSIKDPQGQVKTYAYFNDNSVRGIIYTGSANPTANVSFTYDLFFSRIASMTDGIGLTRWAYVPPGSQGALQVALEDGPFGNDIISYQYDELGRLASRTVDASSESTSYDSIGRISERSSPLGLFLYQYLGQSDQLTSLRSSTGSVWSQWTYENNFGDRRLRSIVNSGAARTFEYSTDQNNRINSIVEKGGGSAPKSLVYAYDEAGRLTGATGPDKAASFSYDASDNLLSNGILSAAYNNVDQIRSIGNASYEYDASGNVLRDGPRTYAWDAEGRLVGIGYVGFGNRYTNIRYDGLGRRLSISDVNGSVASETRYLWCGDSPCQARDAADNVVRRYYDEGQVNPVAGSLLYYATDHLGSVRDALAVQTGASVASYDYDPYGGVAVAKGRTSTDFRFAGLLFHGASGLYFSSSRAYDPISSRWLSRDPVGLSAGINLYSYVNDNPMNRIDPAGENAITIGAGAGGRIGGAIGTVIEPGGGTAVGGAVGAVVGGAIGVGVIIYEVCKQNNQSCPACSPYPDGTIGYKRLDAGHSHYPAGDPHLHLLQVNQNKVDCKCYWNRPTPDAADPPPLPEWVDLTGGVPTLSP